MKMYIQEVNLIVPDGKKAWVVKCGDVVLVRFMSKREAREYIQQQVTGKGS